jgi:hypothetical protein
MIKPITTQSLQLKVLLRDVHPAVWRRVTLSDALSIADLHQVIQLLLGWDDDHLHRFCIQGCEYGIAYVGGLDFDEDAAAVRRTIDRDRVGVIPWTLPSPPKTGAAVD